SRRRLMADGLLNETGRLTHLLPSMSGRRARQALLSTCGPPMTEVATASLRVPPSPRRAADSSPSDAGTVPSTARQGGPAPHLLRPERGTMLPVCSGRSDPG